MPDWSADLRRRLDPLRLEPTREAEIVEELSQHLEDHYAELVGRAVAPEEARRLALSQLAGDTALTEALRRSEPPRSPEPTLGASAGGGPLRGLSDDLRYGLRSLRKSPGLASVALITLAIGIGANALIFSAVNAVLLRPLPFFEPDRLVSFWGTAPEKGLPVVNYPEALYVYFRTRSRTLDPIAAFSGEGFTLTGAGNPELLSGAEVTSNFFRLLGQAPVKGRGFLPEEEAPGKNLVAVLSHGFWQRRFGGDSKIIGTALTLNGIPTTVVGVMPPGFDFPNRSDLWVPLPTKPQALNCWCFSTVGRLRPGRTAADAAVEIAALSDDFWTERAAGHRAGGKSKAVAVPLARELVGDVRTPILVLLGAVGMVLLIACANVANLLLARATARGREMAVRCCIGASPWRIVRQMLVESLLLALGGAVLGVGLAWFGVKAVGRVLVERVPAVHDVGLDAAVLLFTLGATLLTGLAFGLAPALRAGRADLQGALKDGTGGSQGRSRRSLNDAFVVAQVSLSLVLLVGAGLLLRSFTNLLAVDPGFRAENVLVGRVALSPAAYRDHAQVRTFYARLIDRVRGLPGVRAVGLSSTAPFGRSNNQQEFIVEGHEPRPEQAIPVASIRSVSAGYFTAVGTRIVEGRALAETDVETSLPIAIIDQTIAHRYWPGGNSVGRRIRLGNLTSTDPWLTIVGVATSVKHGDLTREPDHYVYVPLSQGEEWNMDVVVRTTGDPLAATGMVREQVRALDPEVPIYDVHTLEEAVSRSLATKRLTNVLLGGFALAALLLAALGIYGVMSVSVTARLREFGVRLALGADPGAVRDLVVRQGMRLALAGLAIGLAGAALITRSLQGLLFGVKAFDPVTFASVAGILAAAALLACYLPARRAIRADPVSVLRDS